MNPLSRASQARYVGSAVARVTLLVEVSVDRDHVATMARHRARSEAEILEELASLFECRVADGVMHVDGVLSPVRVETVVDGLQHTPSEVAG